MVKSTWLKPVRISAFASGCLLFASAANAQQTLSGDYVAVDYNSDGLWVDSGADTDGDGIADGGGLRVRTSTTGTFQNVTYPGTPWQQTTVQYKKGSAAATAYSGNETGAAWTTTSERDLPTRTENIAEYKFTADILDVVRTDTWLVKGKVMQMNVVVSNKGTKAANDFIFIHGMDVDVDYDTYSDFDTYNDTVDTDADGTADYVKSEGYWSGWTVSYGICDPKNQEVGHSSWSTSASVALVDDADAWGDRQMHIRHKLASIAAGASVEFDFVLVFDASSTAAESLYKTNKGTACGCDSDGDGYDAISCGGTDCNDSDPKVYPGATETCNRIDDDCNGTIDDSYATDAVDWYLDSDGDSYGSRTSVRACDAPTNYVADSSDCNDGNASVNPGATEVCNGIDDDCDTLVDTADPSLDKTTAKTWYRDADGDGYGDAGLSTVSCTAPTGYVDNRLDCNDANRLVNPGAREVCNGIDDDCDALVDDDDSTLDTSTAKTFYRDSDGDGYGGSTTFAACVLPTGYATTSSDCDDSNSAVNPGAKEVCNGIDDDCDRLVDTADPSIDLSTTKTYYADSDRDGYGDAGRSTRSCTVPTGYVLDSRDCNDANAAVNPGASEVCNGIDDDCDTLVDDADSSLDKSTAKTYYRDSDRDGYGGSTSLTQCTMPTGYTSLDGDCDDTNNAVNPGATEVCNGIDDDCDRLIDTADSSLDKSTTKVYYKDGDGDGYGSATSTVNECRLPTGYVTNDLDCDDANRAINPAAKEICNGLDDDCDTLIDTADTSIDWSTTRVYYKDGDGDGYGDAGTSVKECSIPAGYVSDNTDCDDKNRAVNPAAKEVCNSIDDDCDTLIDDADSSLDPSTAKTYYVDSDGDGYGGTTSVVECTMSAGNVANSLDCNDRDAKVNPAASEVCNGIDDDCDTYIDDADSSLDTTTAKTHYKDADGDGYGGTTTVLECTLSAGNVTTSTDCDDSNRAVNPGAKEVCNGIDDDCDTLIDDADPYVDTSTARTYYKDADSDGYGGKISAKYCTPKTGYVENDADCDDTNPAVNPGVREICNGFDDDCDTLIDDADSSLDTSTAKTWYKDGDSDGYGGTTSVKTCVAGTGYVATAADCDDSNAAVNPGATEVCNGIDDDCDTLIDDRDTSLDKSTAKTWYKDGDSDGYGGTTTAIQCVAATGYIATPGDCDDANAAVNPAATEVCNGIDDDCDTLVDLADTSLDKTTTTTYYKDSDKDSYGDPSTALEECSPPSGYVTDDNDCDDTDAAVNPAATEYCDSIDNDCDGDIDEDDAFDAKTWYADADSDTYGDAGVDKKACNKPTGYVADNTDCDDAESTTYPGADEYCDLVDNDCDGDIDEDTALDAKTWYADSDGDSFGDATVSDIECYQPSGYVVDDTDCDDTDADIYPGATEVPYDGVDDDCDGADLTDVDGDGYDWDGLTGGTDCDDTDASINPGATETADGVDQDCDGTVDEGTEYYDDDGDGYTEAGGDCDDSDDTVYPSATETCDGVDEDCDGTIDEETDCYDDDGDGYTEDDGDCNDGDDTVNPGATEVYEDGIDNDCDGIVDDGNFDADFDGYTADAGDCDDTNDTVYPGAPEICDGLDNDCDGIVDEGTECYDDDSDGFSEADGDCDDSNPDIGPEAEEVVNGIDDDCDGIVDEGTEVYDDDGDGFTEEGGDCDDDNAEVSPAAEEVENGIDDDCDGEVDEGLDDLDGDGYLEDDGDCDDLNGWVHPDMEEMCDGIDNNCDGVIDEGCEDVLQDPKEAGECGCSASAVGTTSVLHLIGLTVFFWRRRRAA